MAWIAFHGGRVYRILDLSDVRDIADETSIVTSFTFTGSTGVSQQPQTVFVPVPSPAPATQPTAANGYVAWSWLIGGNTSPGTGTVNVTCNGTTRSTNITIG